MAKLLTPEQIDAMDRARAARASGAYTGPQAPASFLREPSTPTYTTPFGGVSVAPSPDMPRRPPPRGPTFLASQSPGAPGTVASPPRTEAEELAAMKAGFARAFPPAPPVALDTLYAEDKARRDAMPPPVVGVPRDAAPGGYDAAGKPITLRNDSEITMQPNARFLGEAMRTQPGMGARMFQSRESAERARALGASGDAVMAARAYGGAAGGGLNKGQIAGAVGMPIARDAARAESAATRQSAERIAQINADAQIVGAEFKARRDRGEPVQKLIPELMSKYTVEDVGGGPPVFDDAGFTGALSSLMGLDSQTPADIDSNGAVDQADQARVTKAEMVMKLAKEGDPRITDTLRMQAEATLLKHRAAVKKAAGLGV